MQFLFAKALMVVVLATYNAIQSSLWVMDFYDVMSHDTTAKCSCFVQIPDLLPVVQSCGCNVDAMRCWVYMMLYQCYCIAVSDK